MINCGTCKENKAPEEFHRSSKRATGRQFSCKACQAVTNLKRYHKKLSADEAYKLKKAEYDSQRRELLGEELRAYDRKRAKNHNRKALHAEETRRRKAIHKRQTPVWANLMAIKDTYKLAKKLSELCKAEYHVDHIIPLRGKDVCGLHVENNLQILEKTLNIRKSNQLTWRSYP